MRIGVYPGKGENAYQSRIQAILSLKHTVVPVPRVKWLALGRLCSINPKLDVTLVSWLENTLVSRKSGRLSTSGVLGFKLKLWVLRRFSHRLIMVRHNEYPHRTVSDDRDRVRALLNEIESSFDAVITHSGHNADHRFYVPHPLYEQVNQAEEAGHSAQTESIAPYCLAFGRISPYKNLVNLVRCWKGPFNLVIAGPCSDLAYLELLQKAAVDRPVVIKAGFLPEEDAVMLMSGASYSVLAHSGEDMVVSGSYFYAISQGTPVLAVRSAFLSWLESEEGPGVHCFDSVEELVAAASVLERKVGPGVRLQIQQEANRFFGDEVVLSHLDTMLKTVCDTGISIAG